MTAPIRLADGRRVAYRERIPVAGRIAGIEANATAFRAAEREGWPLVGKLGSRWVLMTAFLEQQGVPYTIEEETPDDRP